MGEVKSLKNLNDITIGTHGLIVEKDLYRVPSSSSGSTGKWMGSESLFRANLFESWSAKSALEDEETKLFFFDSFCFSEKKLNLFPISKGKFCPTKENITLLSLMMKRMFVRP